MREDVCEGGASVGDWSSLWRMEGGSPVMRRRQAGGRKRTNMRMILGERGYIRE